MARKWAASASQDQVPHTALALGTGRRGSPLGPDEQELYRRMDQSRLDAVEQKTTITYQGNIQSPTPSITSAPSPASSRSWRPRLIIERIMP